MRGSVKNVFLSTTYSTGGVTRLDFLSNDKFHIILYPLIRTNMVKIGGIFMCEKVENQVLITKEEFVDIINRLRESSDLVEQVDTLFRESRENVECDFCNAAGLQIAHEPIVVNLLQKIMRDEGEDISYFIYELDYGRDYEPGCVTDGNGIVDMGTPEALYELLIHQLGREV